VRLLLASFLNTIICDHAARGNTRSAAGRAVAARGSAADLGLVGAGLAVGADPAAASSLHQQTEQTLAAASQRPDRTVRPAIVAAAVAPDNALPPSAPMIPCPWKRRQQRQRRRQQRPRDPTADAAPDDGDGDDDDDDDDPL